MGEATATRSVTVGELHRPLELGLRVVLAAVFVYAAGSKLLHPDQFAENLLDYQLLPARSVNLVALWLPAFELVLALAVAAGLWVRASALAMAGLSVVFLGGLVWVISGPTPLPCSCFSTDPGAPPRTWASLWQEGLLMLMALTLWVANWELPEANPVHLRRHQLAGIVAAVLVVLLILGTVVALRMNHPEPTSFEAGTQAVPPVTLTGGTPPASEAEGAAPAVPRPKLLELMLKTCGHCQEMAPIIEDLKRELQGKVDIQIVDLAKTPDAVQKYDVMFTPAFVFFDAAGKQVGKHEGAMTKDELVAEMRKLGMLSGS